MSRDALDGTSPPSFPRLSTGDPRLDDALGGGFLPGTLVLVVGATGIGKTQLGLRWLAAGKLQEGRVGTAIDLSSRGDSQNHPGYLEALGVPGWTTTHPELPLAEKVFDRQVPLASGLSLLGMPGQRVLRSQVSQEQWDAWQGHWNRQLPGVTQFVYRHLIRGTRRFLLDGFEPTEHQSESVQVDWLEWIYHRMLRQSSDWLARELLRQDFRRCEPLVDQHAYDHRQAVAVALLTTRETLLEQLLDQPWDSGDLAAAANTLVVMGRVHQGNRLGRGLCIVKHRGSACSDAIHPFTIGSHGLQLSDG